MSVPPFAISLATVAAELGARIKDVEMADSESDPLMQLADMYIGAVTRAERDREDREWWKGMLTPRIADIWHFG